MPETDLPVVSPAQSSLEAPAEPVSTASLYPELWAEGGIDVALSCIERVQRTLVRAAEWFHENDAANANRLFAQCMEGLERFTETMVVTRGALKLGSESVAVEGYTLGRIETQMENILRSILECQEKDDSVGIADRIEYALIPNLSLWGQALRQWQRSRESNC